MTSRPSERLLNQTPVTLHAISVADLDAVAAPEGVAHRIEHGLDGELAVALRQLPEALGQLVHQITSGHVCCSSVGFDPGSLQVAKGNRASR